MKSWQSMLFTAGLCAGCLGLVPSVTAQETETVNPAEILSQPGRWRVAGGVQWRSIGDVDFVSGTRSDVSDVPSIQSGRRSFGPNPGDEFVPDDRMYDNGSVDRMTLADIAFNAGFPIPPGPYPPLLNTLLNLDFLSTTFSYDSGSQVTPGGFVLKIPTAGLLPIPQIALVADTLSFSATRGQFSRSQVSSAVTDGNWQQCGGSSYGPYVRGDYFVDQEGRLHWGGQIAAAYHEFNVANQSSTFAYREDVTTYKYGVKDTFIGIGTDLSTAAITPNGIIRLPQLNQNANSSGVPITGVIINMPTTGNGEMITYIAQQFGVPANVVANAIAAIQGFGVEATDLGRESWVREVRRDYLVAWNEIQESLDIELSTISLGLTGEIKQGPVYLSGSIGITPNIIETDAKHNEVLYASKNGGTPYTVASWNEREEDTEFKLGVYAQGAVAVEFSPTVRGELFGRYDYLDKVKGTVGESAFEADLSGGSAGGSVVILL